MRQALSSNAAPQPIGPYSQAIRAAGFIFVSGQGSVNPKTQEIIPGDISAQTETTLENISGLLHAVGSSLRDVIRCTVYLKNMDDFGRMNEVYGRYFTNEPPARSTVEVARLPKDLLVEIDVIALG